MRSNILLSAALGLLATSAAFAQGTDWYTHTNENKPFVRWWWLGSAVDREGLTYNLEEFAKAGLEGKVWQYFTVVPDFRSTGIKNGKRTFDWPCVIRAINTTDVVEVTVEHLDPKLIDHLVQRITTEVPGINRVLFDYTPKPTATVEWE